MRTSAHHLLLILATALVVAACGGKNTASTQSAPDLTLASLAAQRIVVLPTYTARAAPELEWTEAIGRLRDLPRALDTAIANALADRGATKGWILPDALAASHRRNASYGADPYMLAEEPLRSTSLARAQRLPEPLASQVRTIVALHDEARYLLAPVELRFERAGSTMGRATLRLVLLDARASEVRWLGDVRTDSVPAYTRNLLVIVASRVADLVAK
jgi:hypothetical protein